MTIRMVTYPLPPGRTAAVTGGKVKDYASAAWNGVEFATASDNGACSALARILVDAGAPDMAVEMVTRDGSPSMRCASLHGLARTTLRDVRRVRYREFVRELEEAA